MSAKKARPGRPFDTSSIARGIDRAVKAGSAKIHMAESSKYTAEASDAGHWLHQAFISLQNDNLVEAIRAFGSASLHFGRLPHLMFAELFGLRSRIIELLIERIDGGA